MIPYDPQYVWPVYKPDVIHQPPMPRIIHQIWLGDAPPIDLINTWKEKNPHWSHILWTEKTLQGWRFRNQDKLDLMPETSGKCDIMRYEILYHLGGVFIDANTPCEQPLDDSLIQYDCTTILEPGGLLNVNFLAAQPRCELMRLCIEEMDKVASPSWWYVGSAYLTYTAQKHQYRIKVFPEEKVEFRPMSCRRMGVMDHYGIQPRKATQIKSRRLLFSS